MEPPTGGWRRLSLDENNEPQPVRVVVAPTGNSTVLVELADDGTPAGPPTELVDAVDTIARLETDRHPRWVWENTARTYPTLLRAGVRVDRCHDLSLTEALLRMRQGELYVPQAAVSDDESTLFDAYRYPTVDSVVAWYRDHESRIGDSRQLRLLTAAESAGALAAAEMSYTGLPFSSSMHEAHLRQALGPRPADGDRPAEMLALEDEISDAFGRRVNPNSPPEVLAAFARAGVEVTSTRAHVLRTVDHPAVALLLRHRDLAKLFSTNGWSWADTWVRDNRFRPVYVPGGVVSGRWASRGGGALQIPKPLRGSVVADPGHVLVIADAGQLEPRILAALSGDPNMMDAAGADDLYAPVAAAAFAGDRAKAKVAVLGVLYGATAGEARSLLAMLRRRFPVAVEYVERAARAGERGEIVHSHLGRACPPPTPEWYTHGDAHARGRFTRNFVVQATASEWALCLLADLRRRLADDPGSGELVFFQHDEVVVHTRHPERATDHVVAASDTATRLLFGDTSVRFPLDLAARECYAEPDFSSPA
ncbi:bifunctional 3'-5' exonuclease/DNA polymerase [Rhodococcus sp. 14-2470-1a]|nr:bifunctional 3'-5' exonuclease/DNA polymerase [Rhodococcus sp. 14-2470-1a]OZF44330.1 bifunctional 3'-5' exonuclease/DNA polymerase [Rhodococcus sp. 14-2470-1a]